ncbi:MAG: hypothetical protein EB020_09685, partial [Proteobacteria bacterium]|nr:hypothetical protein [Pseudomonadota bacterium]
MDSTLTCAVVIALTTLDWMAPKSRLCNAATWLVFKEATWSASRSANCAVVKATIWSVRSACNWPVPSAESAAEDI